MEHQPRLAVPVVHMTCIQFARKPFSSWSGPFNCCWASWTDGGCCWFTLLPNDLPDQDVGGNIEHSVGEHQGGVSEWLRTKVALTDLALDFMPSMATMGLSQVVYQPTHMAGHKLDLIFNSGWGVGLKEYLDPLLAGDGGSCSPKNLEGTRLVKTVLDSSMKFFSACVPH